MVSSKITPIAAVVVIILGCILSVTDGIPAIGEYGERFDSMSGLDYIGVCINNCAQCQIMLGDYFQGQTCAESCLKSEDKEIPDCEDIESIKPFLNIPFE